MKASPTFLSALLGIGIDGSPWQYMLSMRSQGYGGATRVPLGPFGGDYHFLLEPDVLKQALLEDAEEFFPRRFSVPLFGVLELDKGIVYEQGERHRRQKRLCIPAFEQKGSMTSFLTAVQEETDVLSQQWLARLDALAGRPRPRGRTGTIGGLPLDLYVEMRRLTLSVVLRVTFGLGEAGREFKDAAALSETIGGYLEAIVATANEIPPLWTISPGLSPNYRQVNELLPRLRRIVASVIAERRSAADEGTATGLAESADRADLLSR